MHISTEPYGSYNIVISVFEFRTLFFRTDPQDDLDDDEDEEVSSECKKTSLLQCGSY